MTPATPAATATYEAIRLAFDRGDFGYLDLLDAERTLIDLQSRHLDAMTPYHIAVAETEALIGQSLFINQSAAADLHDNDAKPLMKEEDI